MRAAFLLLAVCAGHAAAAPSALDLTPAGGDVVLHVPDPGGLPKAVERLPGLDEFLKIAPVKESLNATPARRLFGILAHFEKAVGAATPEMLKKVAGGGFVLRINYATGDGPVLLVVQGTDEKAVALFHAATLDVVRGELARAESKEKIAEGEYNGVKGHRLGPVLLARVGPTLYLSNRKELMTAALDLRAAKGPLKPLSGDSAFAESVSLLPKAALARLWVNMKPVQASPGAKALYASPRDDFLQTILFGGYLDVFGRSPSFAVGLTRDGDEVGLHVRLPRGSEGMRGDKHLHLPPEKSPTCPPLLGADGVLYGAAFHMDIAAVWRDREKLFPPAIAKSYTDTDKSGGAAFGGVRLSRLLESAGTSHRFLVLNAGKSPYERRPQTVLPAFAFVTRPRDAERFGRSMETLLRFFALATTGAFKTKIADETYRGAALASYRFDEAADSKEDATDLRFNFTPTFGLVGDHFVICSTLASAKAVIDALEAEKADPKPMTTAVRVDRYYADGFARLMRDSEDVLIANTILERAVPPAEAKAEVRAFIALVEALGGARSDVAFRPREFRYDVRVKLRK